MKNTKLNKIISLSMIFFTATSLTACSGSYQKAPEAVFSSKTVQKDFGEFSLLYPDDWNETKDLEIESAEYSENVFEANSAFNEENLCSSVQLNKTAETSKTRLKSVIKQEDVSQIVAQFQQTYGTDVKLDSSSLYKIDGKQCLNYELSFVKNDVSYFVSQTYFIQNGSVYILTVTAVNGIDKENAFNIPLSLKFSND